MNTTFFRHSACLVYPSCLFAILHIANSVDAALKTTVFHGTVTRPNSHTALNLNPEELMYAINNSGDSRKPRIIDGVTFDSNFSSIDGYRDANAPGRLNDWDADSRTSGPDASDMNEILNDIDCCETPNSYSFEVPNGPTKLQAFWQGNAEARMWDIKVEGELSVDEVTSNGYWDGGRFPRDDNNRYTLFEQIVDVTDGRLDVTFGQLFHDGPERSGRDGHYILSGLVVSGDIPQLEGITIGGGETYVQDFDAALGLDSQTVDQLLPVGWYGTHKGRGEEQTITAPFPVKSSNSLGRGTLLYNAGGNQETDRALSIGVGQDTRKASCS